MDFQKYQQEYVVQGSDKAAPAKAFDADATRVEQRFFQMSLAKQNRREAWDGMQRLYYCNDWQWIVNGDDFNAPIRFPTLRDITMALTDKYMEDLPEAVLRPHFDEDKHLITAKKAYIEYVQRQPQYKKVRRMAIQDMFMAGDGFLRVGFYDIKKKLGDDKEPQTLYRDVGISYVSYRDLFVDETAVTLHDPQGEMGARDIIIRRLMPYSRFVEEIAPREGFETAGVMAEAFIQTMGVDYLVTNSREILEKGPVQMVKLYEYENVETDEYIVVANGHTIFKGSLKKHRGVKGFDLINYKFEPRNDSFWSNCLGELLAPHIYAKDQIFNLELMNLKLSLQPVLAVSGDFGYNPRVHVLQPGGIWTAGSKLQGKVGDNIAPIVAGNSNTKAYEMLAKISDETTITSRANIQSLEFSQGQTATQTLEISQSQNAHNMRINAINEIEAETVLITRMVECMESFMESDEKAGVKKRKIPIKNNRVRQGEKGDTVFFSKNGFDDYFYMTDKMIDVPCRTEVIDKRSEKVAQVELMGRIMQFIPLVTNVMQVDPQVGQRLNVMGLIEQAVDAMGLDHSKTFNDDNSIFEDEYEMLKEEIILGNNVTLPLNETRKESTARLKFLLAFEKDMRDEFTKDQQRAFDYVLEQVMENITRNHLNERYKTQENTGMAPEEQMLQQQAGGGPAGAGGLPGGQVPFAGNTAGASSAPESPTTAQALGGSIGGKIKPVPQPDPSVLNPSGRELV